jgi:autotransporter-associated beta strand protein
MKTSCLKLASIGLTLLGGAAASSAAVVTLSAADPVNTTSFNAAGKWDNSAAPSAANDYFTGAYFMRTPGDSGGVTYTFAGHSLTLNRPSSSGVRSVIVKGGNSDTFIINNLTNAFGGILENGGSGNVAVTFTGNLWTIAANSAVIGNQGSITIGYPLLGADGVILTNAGGNSTGISYAGDNSAFKGKFYIVTNNFGNGGGNTKVTLNSASGVLGNPATFTPDQYFLHPGCTLQDNIGLAFVNANSGITIVGNATLSTAGTTIVGIPITDYTNGVSAGARLTLSGGTLILSNANNVYTGGTSNSAGTLQLAVDNALPSYTNGGNVAINGTLDLNGHNATINGLIGSGTIDNAAVGTATLTFGANGASSSFSGSVQNSSGALSLVKIGGGTAAFAGLNHSGSTVAAGGVLSLTTSGSVPSTPGSLVVSNFGTLSIDASGGNAMPASSLVVGLNGSLALALNSTAIGVNATSGITFQDNATNSLSYGVLTANPTAAALSSSGSISAPGTNIVINISATGLKTGQFKLIQYGSGTLASIANFHVFPPPGVNAFLSNNVAAQSVDLVISTTPNQLAWNGAITTIWDLATANWTNVTSGGLTLFQQYTNGSVIAGDAVFFDDSLYNDFINPPATNIFLNSQFYAFPVVFNSTLPYSISGTGGIQGVTALIVSNTGTLKLLTSNSYTGGTTITAGTLAVTNDSALGSASGAVTLGGGTLAFGGTSTSTRPVATTAASSIGVSSGAVAQLNGSITGSGALTKIDNGTLALGGNNSIGGSVYVGAGTLNITAGSTTLAATTPSSVGYENGSATMNLSSTGTFTSLGNLWVGGSDQSGTGYAPVGVLNISAGTVKFGGPGGNNAHYGDGGLVIGGGNNFENAAVGTVNVSGGTSWCTNDLIVGFAGLGSGTLNITGGTFNVGAATTKWAYIGKWDTEGGYVNVSSGNLNLCYGSSLKFSAGGTTTSTTNVFTQSGGVVAYYSDGGTTLGGTGDLNLAQSGSTNANSTYNLNGGTLIVPQVASASTTPTRTFNFNGGTLKAAKANTSFFSLGSGNAVANVRNGGMFFDSTNFDVTISQALVHSTVSGDNAIDGGLTKRGSGTLTLTGANTYTGPTTNTGGTLAISGTFTNASGLYVNAGVVQFKSTVSFQGPIVVSNTATVGMTQVGSTPVGVANVTLNGAASGNGATLSLTPGSGYSASVAMANCGTLTLNGTNSIFLAAAKVGANALLKYSSLAGTGNCTNLTLPQGATGYVSNSVADSTIYVVVTSAGPGLVWTGTNAASPNLWDIGTTTNWLVNTTPTTYRQILSPGDAVTFNDVGSGTVTLSSTVAPVSLLISNNSKSYTFGGAGIIAGSTGIVKQGAGSVLLNLTNSSYVGDTTVNGGTLQLGNAAALPATGSLIVGANGTVKLAGFSVTASELTGAGVLDNNSGNNPILTVGGSAGGVWNGTITNTGGGGVALHKTGSGTWVVGGPNYLTDGQAFSDLNEIDAGATIITNGGSINIPYLQLQIAKGAGSTASVVVAGGKLTVTNNVISVGYGSTTANGTLIVNSGTIDHTGNASAAFASVANSIDVGAQGATGTLIVNGGQVLNDSPLFLGDLATSTATFYLNGGLVRASSVVALNTPVSAIAYFNGGTLQAATETNEFMQGISAQVQSGGLVFDDGGYVVSLTSQALNEDPASPGGGLTKIGAGTLYINSGCGYTGTTRVSAGTLGGIGSLNSPVVVASGGNLAPGNGDGIGVFSLQSTLTLQGKATFRISKSGANYLADRIEGVASANYGGTLVVSNIGPDDLVAGDSFSLVNASAASGVFNSIAGSPGTGLRYVFTPSTGVLSVAAVNPNPTNLTAKVSGGTLTLTWPGSHQGWILQAQTNSISTGLSNNWFDVVGSDAGTNAVININSANGTVFYRLRLPQ